MTTASGFHKIIHDSSESHKFFTRYAALIANVDDDNNDAGAPPAAGAGARKRNEERVLLLQLCARRKYAPSLSKSEKIYDRSLVTLDDGADVFVRVLHKLECANEAYRESRTGLLIPSEAWAVYMTINLSSTIDAYALLQQQMSERLIAASRGHPMGVSSPMELFLSAVHTTGGGRFEKLDVDSKEADRVGSLKALFAEHAIKPAFVIESKNGYHVVVDNKRSYGSKTGRKALLAFLETNAAWIHVEDKSTHPSVIVPGTLQGGFPTRLIDDCLSHPITIAKSRSRAPSLTDVVLDEAALASLTTGQSVGVASSFTNNSQLALSVAGTGDKREFVKQLKKLQSAHLAQYKSLQTQQRTQLTQLFEQYVGFVGDYDDDDDDATEGGANGGEFDLDLGEVINVNRDAVAKPRSRQPSFRGVPGGSAGLDQPPSPTPHRSGSVRSALEVASERVRRVLEQLVDHNIDSLNRVVGNVYARGCETKEVFDVDLENNLLKALIQQVLADDRDIVGSFFVCNLQAVVRRYHVFRQLLPRVKPFYAVKACPEKTILATLHALGCGFDCASQTELQSVLALGADPNDVIYANPCKQPSHIAYARDAGVSRYTFDNAAELRKLVAIDPDAEVVLRLLVDDSLSIMPFSTKFGASPEETQVLVAECRALNARLVGFSFHVGSGCQSAEAFIMAVRRARAAFDVAIASGFTPTLLDIGGGFSGGTRSERLPFATVARAVAPVLDELFDESVTIIAEPGRYFCTAPFALAVSVNSVRVRERRQAKRVNTIVTPGRHPDPDESAPAPAASGEQCAAAAATDSPLRDGEDNKETLYYVSDGVYGSFNNIVFDHATPKPLLLDDTLYTDETPRERACIFGPTCDSIDVVAKDVKLPRLNVGDWLYFESMGAYTLAAASGFNGFFPPPVKHFI